MSEWWKEIPFCHSIWLWGQWPGTILRESLLFKTELPPSGDGCWDGDHLKVREPQVGLDRPWVRGISERQLWRAGEQISSTCSYGIWKLWSWGCRVEQNLEPPTWPSLLLDQTSDTHVMHTPQQHKPQFNWLSPILRITGSIQHSKTQKEDVHLFFSPIWFPCFP